MFLGVDVNVIPVSGLDTYTLEVKEREIKFEDLFFSKGKAPELYKESNLPKKIKKVTYCFISPDDLICLWGDGGFIDQGNTIRFTFDIFASAFFMLTRWEEFLQAPRDKHERFLAIHSIAFKHQFLRRPIVNEYADFLWKVITHFGYKGSRREHIFEIIPTHDIDSLSYWDKKRKKSIFKNILADIFLRKNIKLAISRSFSFLQTLNSQENDPSNVFEYFIDLANKNKLTARFYFLAGGKTVYDNPYSFTNQLIRSVFTIIAENGHVIGVHPSYGSYKDPEILENERERLTRHSQCQINEGRQHYFRFDIPLTWRIWYQAGLLTDSTMYYPGHPGFRCGTCLEYPVFEITERKTLSLKERPLIVMDTDFKGQTHSNIIQTIRELKEQVRKHGGKFTFLWHNDKVNTPEWISLKQTFEKAFYEE